MTFLDQEWLEEICRGVCKECLDLEVSGNSNPCNYQYYLYYHSNYCLKHIVRIPLTIVTVVILYILTINNTITIATITNTLISGFRE